MKFLFLILALLSLVTLDVTALTNGTICYCDCCKGSSSCAPVTTYVNSSVQTCSLNTCYGQCYRLPACQISGHNGSVAAYCSSDQLVYSSNPQWDGYYVALVDSTPSGCCHINSATITTVNSSLNVVGTVSCSTDVTTLILPFPTGNTLAFQLGSNMQIAMTSDNSRLLGHNIDSAPQCNFTLSRSNGSLGDNSSSSTGIANTNSTSSTGLFRSSSTGIANANSTSSTSLGLSSSTSSTGNSVEVSSVQGTGGSNNTSTNSSPRESSPIFGAIISVVLVVVHYAVGPQL